MVVVVAGTAEITRGRGAPLTLQVGHYVRHSKRDAEPHAEEWLLID